MKAYFIGLVIMGGCLLYGCHTKQKKGENSSDYSADSQSIARQDTLPLPTDTHAASSVSTEGWTAKQIRDSIELFFGKEYDTLPYSIKIYFCGIFRFYISGRSAETWPPSGTRTTPSSYSLS